MAAAGAVPRAHADLVARLAMGKDAAKPARKGGVSDDMTVSDARFSKLHNDPRFMRFPAAQQKVKIDSRFSKMFSDPNFSTGGAGRKTDKRGRRTEKAKKSTADDLKEYYDLEDEDEGEGEDEGEDTSAKKTEKKPEAKSKGGAESDPRFAKTSAFDDDDESDEDEDDADEDDDESDGDASESESDSDEEAELENKLEASRDRMRGVGLESSSDESDDESDGDASESESEGVIPQMLAGAGGHTDDVPTTDATRRVAIVDQEWQHLRAVDLLVVLRSFAPKTGRVERVTVYPSDFGLERMREEAVHGPLAAFGKTAGRMAEDAAAAAKKKKGARKKNTAVATGGDSDSDDGTDSDSESSESGSESEDADATRERMRQYERDRMRYYYAVAECDCVDTAHAVYQQCDGLEFERSACKLDLRYVQDDQSFDGREVRDVATDVPADYEPPEFQMKALQQTNVKLSWDDDDPTRKKAFNRKLTEDKLKDEDFAAYMASASEDESEDDREVAGSNPGSEKDAKRAAEKKKYLALLLSGDDATDAYGGRGRRGKDDDRSDSDDGSDSDAADEGFKRATWSAADAGGGDRYGNKGANRRGGDMEVTFHAGLEDFGARMRKRKEDGRLGKDAKPETTWEKHLREMKEKRDRKKAEKKLGAGKIRMDDVDDDGGEDGGGEDGGGFDDPFFADAGDDVDWDAVGDDSDSGDVVGDVRPKKKKSTRADDEDAFALKKEDGKKKKKRAARLAAEDPAAARERADLELLMMDDDALRGDARVAGSNPVPSEDAADFGARPRKSRRERLAEKKRRNAERRRESDDEDDEAHRRAGGGDVREAKVDVSDDRFRGLFENHAFALDPTDPRYKDVKSAKEIASERDRRRREGGASGKKKKRRVDAGEDEDGARDAPRKKSGKGDAELTAMVSGLKRKSAAAAAATKRK